MEPYDLFGSRRDGVLKVAIMPSLRRPDRGAILRILVQQILHSKSQ